MDTSTIDPRICGWLRTTLDLPEGTKIRVRAQNMHKDSKAARALRQRGLDADTVRWAWISGGKPQYLGAFVRNAEIDAGKIHPDSVFYGRYTHVTRGREYTFFRIGS